MSRRKAVWIALTVGMVTVAVLVLAGRLRRRPIASRPEEALDPAPQSISSTATSTGDVLAASTDSATPAATTPIAEERAEHPLAMWIRLTIVGVALVAFLAVSLIATKTV